MNDPVKKELAAWKQKHSRDVSARCFGTQGGERWTDGPWWEAASGKASSGRCKSLPEALEKLAGESPPKKSSCAPTRGGVDRKQ